MPDAGLHVVAFVAFGPRALADCLPPGRGPDGRLSEIPVLLFVRQPDPPSLFGAVFLLVSRLSGMSFSGFRIMHVHPLLGFGKLKSRGSALNTTQYHLHMLVKKIVPLIGIMELTLAALVKVLAS